ncbi:type II toxin-antitoxin system HicB family antitoxin [Microaerobacter geothermalis]|uniref:type II toxin-antitoxin system HicB family antitoxin n=1 Tax=Microaerobacter geothermalis TaxID=674972 RepID=UPI001F239027|nr:type II toxin-antitoxin system HicB family antitoxin [Microaerobacter geothermalis]MCF6093045.1 type II toxin-antitoxin system HicB family antitoxin [Microaerobacter geothermalis]
MATKTLPVLIEQDESGYFIVTCPVLKGCYTQGKTLKEAMDNIKEAIELCLEELDQDELGAQS